MNDAETRSDAGAFGAMVSFLGGALVGTVLTLLLAPRSGKEARRRIGQGAVCIWVAGGLRDRTPRRESDALIKGGHVAGPDQFTSSRSRRRRREGRPARRRSSAPAQAVEGPWSQAPTDRVSSARRTRP